MNSSTSSFKERAIKDLKMFLKKAALFSFVFALVILAYWAVAYAYSSTPGMENWTHDTLVIKDKIANETQSPKLIILAGSNALFGISAEKIENELGVPTVNYGVHAGLDGYIFDKAKQIAKPGDTILMPLEYQFLWYRKKMAFSAQTTKERYLLTYDRQDFEKLSMFDKLNIVLVQLEDLLINIRSYEQKIADIYDAQTLNAYGDETINVIENRSTEYWRFHPITFPEHFYLYLKAGFIYDGPNQIAEFAGWCKANNVSLIASYPSIIYSTDYETPAYKDAFGVVESFYKGLGIQILGTPIDFAYPAEMFYDTEYHLNNVGREKRTALIITQLKVLLNNTALLEKIRNPGAKSNNTGINGNEESGIRRNNEYSVKSNETPGSSNGSEKLKAYLYTALSA